MTAGECRPSESFSDTVPQQEGTGRSEVSAVAKVNRLPRVVYLYDDDDSADEAPLA